MTVSAPPTRPAIRGSLTPIVTPFSAGDIDEASFTALVAHQMDNGGHGVAVAGTTGEPTSLTLAERERLFHLAAETVDGRGAVLAGTGTSDFADTVRLGRAAHRAGATAALIVVPYFVQPPQRGLLDWFRRAADESPLPVILYDIPGRAGVGLSVETTAALARHENIVGVKLARADLIHASNVIASCGSDFGVYCGVEALCFPMLVLGGAGHVSATGNLFPSEMATMADSVFAGDFETARSIHYRLLAVNEAIFFETNPIPLKAMLALRGLAKADVRPPLAPANAELVSRLEAILAGTVSA